MTGALTGSGAVVELINGLSNFFGAGAFVSLTDANAFLGELSGESFFIQFDASIFFGGSFILAGAALD